MLKSSGENDSRRKKFLAILILISLLVVSTASKFYVDKARGPVSQANPTKKFITIPSGSTTGDISVILKENGLINNELIFKLYAKIESKSSKFKAGMYELNTGMDQEKIMDELVKGGKLKTSFKFTIPEGFELKQIADKLAAANLIDRDKFIALTSDVNHFDKDYMFLQNMPEGSTLEGYLYPNTSQPFKNPTK